MTEADGGGSDTPPPFFVSVTIFGNPVLRLVSDFIVVQQLLACEVM